MGLTDDLQLHRRLLVSSVPQVTASAGDDIVECVLLPLQNATTVLSCRQVSRALLVAGCRRLAVARVVCSTVHSVDYLHGTVAARLRPSPSKIRHVHDSLPAWDLNLSSSPPHRQSPGARAISLPA